MINIVLYEPEIPENTGNIMRTCAGTNSRLHLIEPLGFALDEKKIKRSGVNYIDKVNYQRYLDFEDFQNKNQGEYYYFTRYGTKPYSEIDFSDSTKNIYLIFKPIGKWGGNNDQNIDTIPPEFTGFTRLSLIKKMLSTNFQVSNDINFEFLSEICYANYENKFTIYSDGSIGKCTLKDTDNCGSGYVIGDIKKGFFDVDYKTLSAWSALNTQEMEKKGCFDCICFPFCLSTCCPLAKIENRGTSRCTESKSILEELILEEYEQRYKK